MKMRLVIKFFVLIAAFCCFSGFAAGEALAKPKHWKQEEKHSKHWSYERHDPRRSRGGREHYIRRPEHRRYPAPRSYHRSYRHDRNGRYYR